MLPWLFSVTDHEAHQNLVRKSVTHSAAHCVPVSFFLYVAVTPPFPVHCVSFFLPLCSGHPTIPRALCASFFLPLFSGHPPFPVHCVPVSLFLYLAVTPPFPVHCVPVSFFLYLAVTPPFPVRSCLIQV